MNKKELKELALDDLKRSGLDLSDYNKMKLQVCDEEQAEQVLNSGFSTFGYVMPYFDIKGNVIDNIRFRFLEELLNAKGKNTKYSQLKGSPTKLYFPPCIKWNNILKDSSISIVFTEGEKKAYAACKKGIPTIGLPGVWAFKSKKLQKSLIDDFKDIILSDRKVIICFDNDSHTNTDILKAMRAFAKELDNAGANVVSKELPFDPYQKIGMDDYLLTNSKKDFYNLKELEFTDITELDNLNEEVAYIQESGKIYDFSNNLFMSESLFIKLAYSNRTMQGEDGLISVPAKWVVWPGRRTHRRLTYQPGKQRVTKDNEYNLWSGWGTDLKKGDITLFTNAVNKIFDNKKGNNQNLVDWFFDWIAYPIQNPGAKMLSAVMLQSVEQGTGKSTLGLCIGAMYGDNYKLVDDAQLSMAHNEWAVNKQFILGDEISGKDRRGEADRIKNLITRPTITINKKFQPTYSIPDCINYFFTSNHVDSLNIDPDDRRIFFYSILAGIGLTLKEGRDLENFRKGNGTAYLLNYFIKEHKISKGFDHRSRPPVTEAKLDLIDSSLTDMERYLSEMRVNADFMLVINGVAINKDLFTATQIASLYSASHPQANVTLTSMGKALNKIFYDAPKFKVRTSTGIKSIRAMRNFGKWANADSDTVKRHFDKYKDDLERARARREKFRGKNANER